jgi:hypothetical protein
MSARDDATLSAQERAALAGLEARAEADDPKLAAQLSGHGGRPSWLRVPGFGVAVRLNFRPNPLIAGPLLGVLGVVGLVLGLAISLVISVAGLVALTGGLLLMAGVARSRVAKRRNREQGP